MDEFTPEQRAAIGKVVEAEVERRLAALEAGGPTWQDWLRGAARSWTMWSGGLLVVLPELMEVLAPLVTESLGPDAWRRTVQLIGVAMVLLRIKTTQPLPEKGVPT